MLEEFFPPDEDRPSQDVALVSTQQEVVIGVKEVSDDRTPEGMTCMASYLNERLIARSVVHPEFLDELLSRDVFAEPVRLALAAVEGDPGLQCRLFALLPAQQFQEEEEPEEPWAASVPKFEAEPEEEEVPEDAVVPLLLGHILRFTKDRKHPDDLASEAADVLQAVVSSSAHLGNVVDKVLEDLLEDPGGPEKRDEDD